MMIGADRDLARLTIATINGFTDVARCEASIPEVTEFYRPHGADVFAACEILPPPLTVPKSR
jgi:hypothetical protein